MGIGMKIGSLVFVCPGDPTIGVFLGPDEEYILYDPLPGETVHPLNRSKVLFDAGVYSVPTFQLEVTDESG